MEIVPAEEGPCDHDDAGSSSLSPEISSSSSLPEDQVQIMIDACWNGRMHIVQQCLAVNPLYARQQLHSTGQSPLMAAASSGNHALCLHLLEAGAPWNAVDRKGQCAGNYASDHNHQSVVDLLVEWAVRSELILGQIERSQRCTREEEEQKEDEAPLLPIEHQSSTKPDYLRQRLQYTPDGRALLDADRDAVMMEWERPLMNAHAQILMEEESSLSSSSSSLDGGSTNPSTAVPPVVRVGKRVLNVGFGMGIVDTALQSWNPSLHIIIEAHPDVYNRMIHDKWDQKHNVRICFGKWQDVLPQLILEQVVVDGIFYDTVRCLFVLGRSFLPFRRKKCASYRAMKVKPRRDCSSITNQHIALLGLRLSPFSSFCICDAVRGTLHGFGRFSYANDPSIVQTTWHIFLLQWISTGQCFFSRCGMSMRPIAIGTIGIGGRILSMRNPSQR